MAVGRWLFLGQTDLGCTSSTSSLPKIGVREEVFQHLPGVTLGVAFAQVAVRRSLILADVAPYNVGQLVNGGFAKNRFHGEVEPVGKPADSLDIEADHGITGHH